MSKIVWLVGVGGIFYSQISVIRCNAVQSEVGLKKSQRGAVSEPWFRC